MTHKQTKSNRTNNGKYKGKTRIINNEESCIIYSKPLLLSSEDEESLALHSAMARMVMKRNKARCFRRYTHIGENINSVNKTIYHVSPITTSYVPSYRTSIQSVHWNPCMEICMEEPHFNDSVKNFKYQVGKHHEAFVQAQNNVLDNKGIYSFKDNIVRYSDNSTMTWPVNDVGCGVSTPVQCLLPVDELITNVVVNDTSVSFAPQLPVLEKSVYETNVLQKDTECINEKIYNATDPNIDNNDSHHNISTLDLKESKMVPEMIMSAHIEVKEISNLSMKTISTSKLSKVPEKTTENCDLSIPHTHKVHSKYHCDCASMSLNVNDLSKKQNPTNVQNLMNCKRTPSIRLPRRVVTSQRNINVFIEKRKR